MGHRCCAPKVMLILRARRSCIPSTQHFIHGVLRRRCNGSLLVAAHLCNTADMMSLMTLVTLSQRNCTNWPSLSFHLLQHIVQVQIRPFQLM